MESNETDKDKAAAPSGGDKLASALDKFFKVEDGPAYGGGKLSAEDDKKFCSLAHLFSFVIWPWKRAESPAVEVHGKEALNMLITMFIFFVIPFSILMTVLGTLLVKIHLWGIVMIAMYLVDLAILAMFVYGFMKAREGKLLRYPLNLNLIK